MITRYLLSFLIGGIGGWFFNLIHAPIPWLLGSITSISVVKIALKKDIYWSQQIRNIAMVVLGYMMGRTFTPETGQSILALFPVLALVTLVNVLLCLLASLIIWCYTDTNLATSLFGSLPAGLSQVATVCEKVEEADIAIVTIMQSIRLITVIVVVPFIALHGLSDKAVKVLPLVNYKLDLHDFSVLSIYLLVIILLLLVGKYFKIANTYIIFPLVGTATLALSGLDAPALPNSFIVIAQLCVGIHIGNILNVMSLTNWKRIFFYSMLNILGIVAALAVVDYFIALITPMSFLTAFISTAPGGMAEMGITAMTVNADVSTVATFQLVRLLLVIVVITPLLCWWFNHFKTQKLTYNNTIRHQSIEDKGDY